MGTNSSTELPTLTHGIGMAVGAFIVILVALAAFVIFCVMAQKLTGRSNFVSRNMDAGKLALPFAGALLLGSASAAVAWSSTLYTPAKVAEPKKVVAAYTRVNDIESKEIYTAKKDSDNLKVAKAILGSKFDELNEKYDLSGDNNNAKNFSRIEYMPKADDENAADPCYKIKVSYKSRIDNFDPKAPLVEHATWVEHDDFDSGTCSGEAKKF